MSAKATPQIQKSATPAPPASTHAGLANVRAFTDETAIQEQESSTTERQAAAAAAPPPEDSTNQPANAGYNFSRISVTDYVPATVQTKLVVGAPGDKYEQEADAMADKVMSMTSSVQKQEELVQEKPEIEAQPVAETVQRQTDEDGTVHLKPLTETIQRQTDEDGTVHLKPLTETIQRQTDEDGTVHLKPLTETIQRQTDEDGTVHLKPLAETVQRQTEEDGTVHLKPLANQISPAVQGKLKNSTLIARKENGAFTASDSIESRIKSKKGTGENLPNETRDFMESRFGNDFGGVKVHTGSDAVQLSKELGAQAFTHGEDIYFNSGKYSPHTDEGKTLLAHELTHTIQQTGPKVKAKRLKSPEKANKIQRQKETLAVAAPPPQQISQLKSTGKIQQEPADKDKKKDSEKPTDKDKKTEAEKPAETAEKGKENQKENNSQNPNAVEKVGSAPGATDSVNNVVQTPKQDSGGAGSGEAQPQSSDAGGGAGDAGAAGGIGDADAATSEGVPGAAGESSAGATVEPISVPQNTGEQAPDSPEADPAFQALVKQSQGVTTQYTQHPAPETKAAEAQQAAEDPQKQVRDAQATQVEQTSQQETKAFDRKVFEQAILDKLGIAVPKNLEEADEFSKNNKLGEVKNQLTQQVEQNKEQAAGGLPQANKTEPNADTEQPKPVEAIPDILSDVGQQQSTVEADKAVPKEKSEKEIEKPLEKTAENLDKTFGEIQAKLTVGAPGDKYEQEADRMAERVMAMPEPETAQQEEPAPHSQRQIQTQIEPVEETQNAPAAPDIGSEQLLAETVGRVQLFIQRKEALEAQPVEQPSKEVPLNKERLETWGEMGGSQAINALKDAKKHTTEGPKEYRQQEETQLTTAQGEAVATADKNNQEMFAERSESMNQVGAEQQQTKTEDEQKRSKVTGDIDKIYQETKTAVDARLKKLDDEVNQEFERGSQAAKQKFEGYVALRMLAYKAERYSGIGGGFKWAKDKLFGMPAEVNKFYEDGKQVYTDEMKKSISTISTIVEKGLNEAKVLVDKGRQQVNDYVNSLSEDLKEVGAEAALNIQSQFDSLEQSVRDKQNQLVESLSQKYQENLKELDKRIEQLQQENKGLVDKALDLLADVAKAIIKAVLTPIKRILEALIGDMASKVIDAIIDDPGKFMKNLFKGIGDGIKNFASNIGKHLLNGLVTWLFGNIGGELQLPEKFDLKGFLDILLQLLGLTKDFIFGIAEQFLGSNVVELIKFIIDFIMQHGTDSLKVLWDLVKAIAEVGVDAIMFLLENGMEAIESLPETAKSVFQSLGSGIESVVDFAGSLLGSLGDGALELVGGLGKGAKFVFDFFGALFKDGLVGTWEFLKSSLGTLKEMFMKDLSQMLIVEVVKQGVMWLVSLLNPASGLAKIAKAIYDVINFFIERKEEIKAFVDSILKTLKSIIDGNPGGMAQAIENALAMAIPTVLGFLASLLGIGDVPNKIKKIFTKMKEPVTKIVTTIFEKGKAFFQGIAKAAKKGFKKAKKAVKNAFKGKKDPKDKEPKDNAKERITAASTEAQGVVKNSRVPEEVDKQLPGIASKHKLDKLKLKKKDNKKYQIEGKTKRIKAQRQAESGVSLKPSSGMMYAQLKGENPWKNPKNKVIVKNKVKGDKKKANFTLKAQLLDKDKILEKVTKDLKKLVKKKSYAHKVDKKLPELKNRYELQSLTLTKKRPDGKEYEIIAETAAAESASAQREAMPGAASEIETAGVETAIQRSQGKGQELAPTVRAPMEDAFGFDFSSVRIHADTEGDRLSRSLEARAFTTGNDIFFRQGTYAPESPSGQRLLAHELTHVVQQSGESAPVNSASPFFTRTAQRVSESAPHFVQRQAEAEDNSQETASPAPEQAQSEQAQKDASQAAKKAQRKALAIGVGAQLAAYGIDRAFSSSPPEIKHSTTKNKLTLQVTLKNPPPQKQEEKKKAAAVQEQDLPDELVHDIVGLIQQIVNQNPKADIVQKKLDKVRADYGLKALQVVGTATTGDSFTYDIRMKGPVEKPDKPTQEVAEAVKTMGGTLLDMVLDYAIDKTVSAVSNAFKSKDKKPAKKEAAEEKKEPETKTEANQETKPKQPEKKPPAEPEKKVAEEEKHTGTSADTPKQKNATVQKPLDVNTQINRLDAATVEVSVRADPKQQDNKAKSGQN